MSVRVVRPSRVCDFIRNKTESFPFFYLVDVCKLGIVLGSCLRPVRASCCIQQSFS